MILKSDPGQDYNCFITGKLKLKLTYFNFNIY